MKAAKYRKLPVEVDAMAFTGDNADEVLAWIGDCDPHAHAWKVSERGIVISTLEGEMRADPADWIIRGLRGEFYPCKPDIFDATYEPA